MRESGQTAMFAITMGAVEHLHPFTLSGTWLLLMDPASTNTLFPTKFMFLSLHSLRTLQRMAVKWRPFDTCILGMRE